MEPTTIRGFLLYPPDKPDTKPTTVTFERTEIALFRGSELLYCDGIAGALTPCKQSIKT